MPPLLFLAAPIGFLKLPKPRHVDPKPGKLLLVPLGELRERYSKHHALHRRVVGDLRVLPLLHLYALVGVGVASAVGGHLLQALDAVAHDLQHAQTQTHGGLGG